MIALGCDHGGYELMQSVQSAARIPSILFAVIEMPIPVPQIRIPLSHVPFWIAWPTFLA